MKSLVLIICAVSLGTVAARAQSSGFNVGVDSALSSLTFHQDYNAKSSKVLMGDSVAKSNPVFIPNAFSKLSTSYEYKMPIKKLNGKGQVIMPGTENLNTFDIKGAQVPFSDPKNLKKK